jgi:hypothetical protein
VGGWSGVPGRDKGVHALIPPRLLMLHQRLLSGRVREREDEDGSNKGDLNWDDDEDGLASRQRPDSDRRSEGGDKQLTCTMAWMVWRACPCRLRLACRGPHRRLNTRSITTTVTTTATTITTITTITLSTAIGLALQGLQPGGAAPR